MATGQISVELTRNAVVGNYLPRPIIRLLILLHILLKSYGAHFLIRMFATVQSKCFTKFYVVKELPWPTTFRMFLQEIALKIIFMP